VPDPSIKSATRPAVRLRPVPPLDPPFEDEVAPEMRWATSGHGQLALDLRPFTPGAAGRAARGGIGPGRSAATRARPARSGSAPDGPHLVAPPDGCTAAPPATRSADPAARQAARRFLVGCLEVLNGYRPLAHLRPLVNPADLDTVLPQLTAGVERLGRARRAGKRPPVQLRVVRVCEPRPGAVEAAAVLGDAGRTWALAFRLERRQGRWFGTAVRVL
jgi:hypothetical protein